VDLAPSFVEARHNAAVQHSSPTGKESFVDRKYAQSPRHLRIMNAKSCEMVKSG
jgi:hypothetical protein